jgi:hypothetical protein
MKMNDENVLDWNLVQNFIIIIIFCIFFIEQKLLLSFTTVMIPLQN